MPGALGALPGLPRARVREVIRIMDTWPRSERFIRRETEIDGIGGERAPLSANSANSAAFETQSGRSGSTAGTAPNAPKRTLMAYPGIGRVGKPWRVLVGALSAASEAAALYLCRLRRLFSDRAGRGTSDQPNDWDAHQQQKAAEHDKAGGDTPPIGDRTHYGRDQDRG
jgi:hypothetical protein